MSDDWIEVDGHLYARVEGADYQNMTEIVKIAFGLVACLGTDRTLEQHARGLDNTLSRFFAVARDMELLGKLEADQLAGVPLTAEQKVMMDLTKKMAEQRRKEAKMAARYGVTL